MDSEGKLQQYLLLGKSAKGRTLCELILKATAEPGLFSYGELLDLPSVQELQAGEFAAFRLLLELYCYGTWPEYQAHSSSLPSLTPQHELKLKQLTVATLGADKKVLPYEVLQRELAISTVRDLEDFIITDCFYTGLVVGKLDQRQACLQVHGVVSRDIKPSETAALAQALDNWMVGAQALLQRLEDEAAAAALAANAAATRRKDLETRQEELKKNLKVELERSGEGGLLLDDAGSFDLLEDDHRMMMPGGPGAPGAAAAAGGGLMGRSKR
eukprot:gene5275-5510_t